MIVDKLLPQGQDREAVVKHLEVVFNHIVHYMMNDKDKAQRSEVIWMLEKIRRAAHLVYIYQNKHKFKELENAIDTIFSYVVSIVKLASGSDAVNSAGIEFAANELRRVVKEEVSERRRQITS